MKQATTQLTKLKRIALTFGAILALGTSVARAESLELLNVSYDPTRELYDDYNAASQFNLLLHKDFNPFEPVSPARCFRNVFMETCGRKNSPRPPDRAPCYRSSAGGLPRAQMLLR